MKEKNKSLIQNIGLFTIGSFGSKIVSFLMVPLYTMVLSTKEYGAADLLTSTAALLTPILLLSIQDATLRFSMDPEYQKEDVLSTSIVITIKGSLVLLLSLVIIKIFNVFNIPISYLLFLFTYFIIGALNNIFVLYLKAKNKASIIAISGILCTLITCTSNALLLLVFKCGINGYMISNVIGIFVQVYFQLFIGKIYNDIHIKKYNDLSKPMIQYSSPLIANSISWWVNNASDRYILTWLRGVSANGIYSVSYKIPTILSMFQNIFFNAWSISAIAEFDKEDKDGFIGMNYSIYSFISLLICSSLLIINIPLASFLYKGDYFIAWKCVPFLLCSTVFSGISQFEGSLFAATKKTKQIAKTTVIGAIVNTIGNFIFIYLIGIVGAAFATFLGYAVTWIFRTIYLQKFIRMKVSWSKHLVSMILIILQSTLATFNFSIIFQLTIFIMILVINKQMVIPILKKVTRKKL